MHILIRRWIGHWSTFIKLFSLLLLILILLTFSLLVNFVQIVINFIYFSHINVAFALIYWLIQFLLSWWLLSLVFWLTFSQSDFPFLYSIFNDETLNEFIDYFNGCEWVLFGVVAWVSISILNFQKLAQRIHISWSGIKLWLLILDIVILHYFTVFVINVSFYLHKWFIVTKLSIYLISDVSRCNFKTMDIIIVWCSTGANAPAVLSIIISWTTFILHISKEETS